MAFKALKNTQSTFIPTEENIYNLNLVKQGHNVKIIAGAGTGKSTQLRYMAQSMPEKNFLVLCFNKANADESNKHLYRPKNIFYATLHSIAYRKIVDFAFRKKLAGGYLKWNEIDAVAVRDTALTVYGKSKEYTLDQLDSIIRKCIIDAITGFCRSDAMNPYGYFTYAVDKDTEILGIDSLLSNKIARIAELYWECLADREHKASITHDVYLKLYQLGEFNIETFEDKGTKTFIKPDILVLDEGQDTNPVCEHIFNNQNFQKILVGDPMQQLYAWRGAGDTMNKFTDYSVGYLTKSYRFNETVAQAANKVLSIGKSDMKVSGVSTKESIETQAIICRTNAEVIETLFKLMEEYPEYKFYTSINFKDTFSKLFHIQSCFFDEAPKYPCRDLNYIVNKKTLFKALDIDADLMRLENLRKSITKENTLMNAKKALEAKLVTNKDDAHICVTTIHASKGLEYDYVTIGNGFIDIDNIEVSTLEILENSPELICLLYVGITRARVDCRLPFYLEELLDD